MVTIDYATLVNYASILMTVLFFLVAGANIIVEVLKVFIKKIPTNYLAIAVSIVETLVVFLAWATIMSIKIQWYHIGAALMLGIAVSYGAMFGFDKLKDGWEKWKAIKDNN